MPLRPPAATGSTGESRPIYRKISFSKLVDLFMLDLRQYRDEQPASPAESTVINAPSRTLLGTQGAVPLNVDSWDGYASSRLQILGLIAGAAGNPVPNCVFLTGDIHSTDACVIPANPAGYNPDTSKSLATEFVCTSITSDNVNELVGQPERVPNGLGGYMGNPATAGLEGLIRAFNAWVRDVNLDFHEYSVVDVTPSRTQVDSWVLRSDASVAFAADPRIDPNAACVFRNSYQTLNLTQKVTPAAGPLGPRI